MERVEAGGIIDPLSAGEHDGGARARVRMRLAGALLLAAGAVTTALVLVAPDPDRSDHAALAVCSVAMALAAAFLLAVRNPPAALLHAICPAGSIAATAALAFAEPIGLTPMFYLWPIVVAAYFLPPREVAANFAFALAGCGIGLALWVDPVLRTATFMAVTAIVGVVATVVVLLRHQVLALVVRLGELAARDSLTGALNRRAFEVRLDAELARGDRVGATCALVVLDVDHFKSVNDAFGHAEGDRTLRSLAAVVEGAKRRSDVFGRLGGEEFGLLLPDTDLDGAMTVAEKLRAALARTREDGHAITVSGGATDTTTAGDTLEGMLASADEALYAAKRAGRDRIVRARSQRRAPLVAVG